MTPAALVGLLLLAGDPASTTAHMGQLCAPYQDIVDFMRESKMRHVFRHQVGDGRTMEWWIDADGIYSVVTRPPMPLRGTPASPACISDPDPSPPAAPGRAA